MVSVTRSITVYQVCKCPSSEDMSSISMFMTVEDTFAFIRDQPQQHGEGYASKFHFRDVAPAARGHGRREFNISIQAPPTSLYNRSFGHHRGNESTASSSSVAISYAKYGANLILGSSPQGYLDGFSFQRGPLTAISASPPEKLEISDSHSNHRPSFDSILDDEQRPSKKPSSQFNSLQLSVWRGQFPSLPGWLLPPNQFRPLSVLSVNSVHSPMEEGDTTPT